MYNVWINGQSEDNEILDIVIKFFLLELFGPYKGCDLKIGVFIKDKVEDDTHMNGTDGNATIANTNIIVNGVMQRDFAIELRKKDDLNKQISALAHELTHVHQIYTEKLKFKTIFYRWGTYALWDDKFIGFLRLIPYINRPWELEAYANQHTLVHRLHQLVKNELDISRYFL